MSVPPYFKRTAERQTFVVRGRCEIHQHWRICASFHTGNGTGIHRILAREPDIVRNRILPEMQTEAVKADLTPITVRTILIPGGGDRHGLDSHGLEIDVAVLVVLFHYSVFVRIVERMGRYPCLYVRTALPEIHYDTGLVGRRYLVVYLHGGIDSVVPPIRFSRRRFVAAGTAAAQYAGAVCHSGKKPPVRNRFPIVRKEEIVAVLHGIGHGTVLDRRPVCNIAGALHIPGQRQFDGIADFKRSVHGYVARVRLFGQGGFSLGKIGRIAGNGQIALHRRLRTAGFGQRARLPYHEMVYAVSFGEGPVDIAPIVPDGSAAHMICRIFVDRPEIPPVKPFARRFFRLVHAVDPCIDTVVALFENDIHLHGSPTFSRTDLAERLQFGQNALLAAATAYVLGVSGEKIAKGLSRFIPSGMRQKVTNIAKMKFIEDCYNASPTSMKASLDVLKGAQKERAVAVLGDMLELGEIEESAHNEVGVYAAECADLVVACGQRAKIIADAAVKKSCKAVWFETISETLEYLTKELKEGDCVLFKASHSMQFEKIITGLYTALN